MGLVLEFHAPRIWTEESKKITMKSSTPLAYAVGSGRGIAKSLF
jgi:hypothetical protein